MENLFSSSFIFDDSASDEAKICIVGVGGGGGNAINNMVAKGIHGVDFIAINTDIQALSSNVAPVKIHAGKSLTKGLGAGARPSVGAEALDENREQIEQALRGFDMVFITAGMGGGTGTGGAPVVASIARDLNILSVGIVTRPFECEGKKRIAAAEEGLALLKKTVDTLIVIPNEKLLDIADENTTLIEAFAKADEVLYNATRGISDLITVPGLINLDFADVKTTMSNGGTALMGSSIASGDNRSEKAAIEAISSPLLDGLSITGARNVLVNITAGRSLGIREATTATSIIQREAGDDVEVIFGTVIDETMGDDIRVTVIATGFERAPVAPPKATRAPSISLTDENEVYHYKGEESLKNLDTPAFVRRAARTPISIGDEDQVVENQESSSSEIFGKVRRLQVDDLKERSERIRKDDTETPAFLRKMMD